MQQGFCVASFPAPCRCLHWQLEAAARRGAGAEKVGHKVSELAPACLEAVPSHLARWVGDPCPMVQMWGSCFTNSGAALARACVNPWLQDRLFVSSWCQQGGQAWCLLLVCALSRGCGGKGVPKQGVDCSF